MSAPPYRFVFVVGVSGSGSTMLTRILGGVPGAVALGGHVKIPSVSIPDSDVVALDIVRRFNAATERLWDRQAVLPLRHGDGREMLELVEELRALDAYRNTSHVVYKRSFPFFEGDRYRPDLHDLFELFDDVRLVVIYRDPRASTTSSLRRQFGPHLRACAVVIEEQLTYIAAQLATLDPAHYIITAYEDLCANPVPIVRELARFCNLDEEAMVRRAHTEKVEVGRNDRWGSELSADEIAFLDRFFDARRRRQWSLLTTSPRIVSPEISKRT
jgi:hypothetical protein